MLNSEKFKAAEERAKAFDKWCEEYHNLTHDCTKCCLYETMLSANTGTVCPIAWLDLEANEEMPLPCPYCGGATKVIGTVSFRVACTDCMYSSDMGPDEGRIVAAHNRIARAVMEDKEETP